MRTFALLLALSAINSFASSQARLQPDVDVFPLRRHAVFTYSFQRDSSAYQTITWPESVVKDSGLIEYTILDSTAIGDSATLWLAKERLSLLHTECSGWWEHWLDSTTYLISDSSTVTILENLSGRHELQCSSRVWSFPLQNPLGSIYRFAEQSPYTITRRTAQGWGVTDTLVFTQGSGLVQRNSHGWNQSSMEPITCNLHIWLLQVTVAVSNNEMLVPRAFTLFQNYPNPFNPTTTIQFTIVNRQLTIVKVFDLLGREVATLVNAVKQPGTYTVEFDGSNLSSGVYLCRLEAGNFTQTKRLLLLK